MLLAAKRVQTLNIARNVWGVYLFTYIFFFYSLQFSSSLPSLHSSVPEHWRCPGMQVPLRHLRGKQVSFRLFMSVCRSVTHLNWSDRHSTAVPHCSRSSSDPSGQSSSPSHSQELWMQYERSKHWNSVGAHVIDVLGTRGWLTLPQSWQRSRVRLCHRIGLTHGHT